MLYFDIRNKVLFFLTHIQPIQRDLQNRGLLNEEIEIGAYYEDT